ncbi:MAG: hypothetical protein R2684_15870 [Pyrinomonadaceae bacterium]
MFEHTHIRNPEVVRYVSAFQTPLHAIEVAFNGGAPKAGCENPKETQVVARCLKRANVHWLESPWIETWTKDYGNVTMPDGAWNGIKLAAICDNQAFLGISNTLMEADLETGEPKWSVDTGSTPVYQVIPSRNEEFLIVFNGYYGFKESSGKGNIAAVDFSGKEIWRSELPSSDDIFANPPYFEKGILKSASWNGFTCSIDERSGKIFERKFTK